MAERCPLCAGTGAAVFHSRSAVPVHQNMVYASQAQAESAERGDLRMAACGDCGFVFNAAFETGRALYGEHYDNTQCCSGVFAHHVEALADELVEQHGVRDARIVEVGCGQGAFLRMLVEKHPGNSGLGYDPSYAGPEVALDGRLRFERRFFGPENAGTRADVIVCRHVIEHVAQPLELLAAVHGALAGGRAAPGQKGGARLYFETPCVEWILGNGVIWDFFYEHCSLFSAASLAYAFRKSGFRVAGVRRLFGAQYLWLEGSQAGADGFAAGAPGGLRALAASFESGFAAQLAQWRSRIEGLRAQGPVAIWGAGAKGATFVDLVDRDRALIDCVIDINPNKQGRYIPGTGHPIVGPSALAARGIANALMMNPNYLAESQALVAREGIATRLLT